MNKISWWRTDFGQADIKSVTEAIKTECISQGRLTEEFEKRIARALNVQYAVATTSGSMSLLMALMALGIKRGDEVIVPNRTWIATAHAVLMLGAKVILVDVRPDVPIMDVSKIEKKITSKTRAIMPVHLGGRAVDMEQINNIAKKYGLFVIEDAAQALFSRNSEGFLGTQSDAGCFSLSVAKLIATGQGGFIVTRNKKTCEILKSIRTHGVKDVINASYTRLGFNFRFTDLQASIGIAQLARAKERISHVRAIYERYKTGIAGLPFISLIAVDINSREIPLYAEVLCGQRDKLIKFLASRGIQTRPFYPNLNEADYLKNRGDFSCSRVFGENGLFLPCGPGQSLKNVERVIDTLQSY